MCLFCNNINYSIEKKITAFRHQDPSMQYTIKFENENKQFSFLDVTMINTGNNSYDFKIFRKISITNVQIKPKSNIAPHITMGVFNIFTENVHNKNTLTNIATEHLRNINKPKSNDQNNTKNTKNIKLPRVPILDPKLQKEFKKKGIKTVFTSGANLKSILCQNKTELLPNSYEGVLTKKKVMIRTIEYQHGKVQVRWTLFKMPWSI